MTLACSVAAVAGGPPPGLRPILRALHAAVGSALGAALAFALPGLALAEASVLVVVAAGVLALPALRRPRTGHLVIGPDGEARFVTAEGAISPPLRVQRSLRLGRCRWLALEPAPAAAPRRGAGPSPSTSLRLALELPSGEGGATDAAARRFDAWLQWQRRRQDD